MRSFSQVTTVVLQGALPSRVTAFPFPSPPLCHYDRYVTGSRPEEWLQINPKASIHGAEIENTPDLDRLLKRNNITSLQPPAFGHTCWVLVWPHCGPVQGDKLLKISSWVFAGHLLCCWSQHNWESPSCASRFTSSARTCAKCRPAWDRNPAPHWEMFHGVICTWAHLCHPQRT